MNKMSCLGFKNNFLELLTPSIPNNDYFEMLFFSFLHYNQLQNENIHHYINEGLSKLFTYNLGKGKVFRGNNKYIIIFGNSFSIELISSKKIIQFRPFLVKEQKNLLMAMESDDTETVERNIRQVLNNCTLTQGIDIDSLPVVDIEYYFINLRAKSVGEMIESKYRCNNEVDGKECGNTMQHNLNLMDVKVEVNGDVSPDIQLTDKLSIRMKYPEFGIVKDSVNIDDETELTFNMLARSIEYIYDGEQFYYANEAEPGEMLEFIESLNQEQFEKIENFFNNLPKMTKNINLKCGKCGFDHTIEVEGLENFFG